ncbi:DNA/RNA non-specific endonuclease [Clostridium felsineum]|uniref:DNA/RNA non-specific endonuclease n=1 Tax=Clostridium felsineum TaxID=36839 RepID=UPI00203455E4|nr:DNA/RNA non-specific endonuclease [Clostridium felsineum]
MIEIADEILVVISKMDSFIKELRKGIDKTEAVKNDIKREQRILNNGLSSDIGKAVQGDVTKLIYSSKSILDIMVRMSINLNTAKTEFVNADKDGFKMKALKPNKIYRGDEPPKVKEEKEKIVPYKELTDTITYCIIGREILKQQLKAGDLKGLPMDVECIYKYLDNACKNFNGLDIENTLNAFTMGDSEGVIIGFKSMYEVASRGVEFLGQGLEFGTSKGLEVLGQGITGAKEALSKLTVSSVALAFAGAKGLEQIEETAENLKREEGIIKTALESARRKLDDLYKIVYDGESSGKEKVNETKTLVDKGKQFNNGRKNKLKPDIRYKTGEFDYYYETDGLGRIEKFETDNLQLTDRTERLNHSKNTPGKVKGKDDAGHLAGDRFGGSPKIDNLVSQLSNVNKSQYKKIENKWANAIDEGKNVKIDVEIKYDGDNLRPSGFDVKYEIDGKSYRQSLSN